ncbi:MAG: hypothetical protein Q9159_001354 [Coniocarpon cinnabarinum]
MALLNARRHIIRYVLAALLFLFLSYQFLTRARTSAPTSSSRALNDPVQVLKDNGAYVPVPKVPLQKQNGLTEHANKDERPAVKHVGLQDADQLGELAATAVTGGSNTKTTLTAAEVDKTLLSKILSAETQRSSTEVTAISHETTPTSHAGMAQTSTKTTTPTPTRATPSTWAGDHGKKPFPSPTRPHHTQSPLLVANAYTLASADDFLPHFAALPSQNNLTVLQAMKSCTWSDNLPVNFQFGKDAEWAVNLRNESEITSHRNDWQRFILEDAIPWSQVSDQFSGRGIVIVAGNERSLKRTFVLLRMLNHFNASLPVEIHHHGTEELSTHNKTALKSTFRNVSFSDLEDPTQPVTTSAKGFINYNLKTAALLNSRFAEPLLLDSDNLPVSDPAVLFTSSTYKTYGSIFWPDIARTRPENPIWALSNTPCSMSEYEQESGQLLVNKSKFWYHLQLAKYWSDSEYYSEFLLGDKDTFRFAWHALRTEYGRPQRWLTSVGVVQRPRDERAWPSEPDMKIGVGSTSAMSRDRAEDQDVNASNRLETQGKGIYCGHSFGQHFPDGNDSAILFLHGGLVKTLTPAQIRHARKYGRGLFAAYKESLSASDWNKVEGVRIKWHGGPYLEEEEDEGADGGKGEERRKMMRGIAHCTDMDLIEPRVAGDEETKELSGFEELVQEMGFYWMVEDESDEGL